MARIRTIKPQHWSDIELSKISLQAHLLWIALWNFSDDEGVFENDPILIRSQIFPRRTDVRTEQVTQWIDQLVKARFVLPFTFNGIGYYIHRTFKTHQKIDKPQKSKIPSDVIRGMLDEHSTSDRPCIVEESKVVDSSVKESAHPLGKKIVTPLKTENKEHSPGAEKWTTWPAETYLTLPLPEIKVGSVIELFKITKNTDVTAAQVRGLWNIFKTQHFTGKKFYQDVSDTYSHFINWCKTQNISKNETDRGTNGRIDKNTGAQQLLSSVRDQHNSGRG